ncbi:MAG: hypothetical protein J3Q66DRAFT_329504 [Benniella sp.]|nr:MAG: hypothetical protein J3Q66DRAFT_329504 [Benniella sp.]
MAKSDSEKDLIQTSAAAGATASSASASSPASKPDPDTLPTADTTTTTTATAIDSEIPPIKLEDTSADPVSENPDQQSAESNNDAAQPTDQAAEVIDAAAAATAQAIASAFLTKALTTPIEQIGSEDHAATAAAVAALAASVAAGTKKEPEPTEPEPTTSSSAFDVSNVYSQVLSMAANQKREGKRTAQDDFEQSQAAMALQSIALSLGGATSQSTDGSSLEANGQTSEITKMETDTPEPGPSTATSTAPDVSDSLIAIAHAINFPSQSSSSSKLEVDTQTFAQAILNATHADANKASNLNTSTAASLNGDVNMTSASGSSNDGVSASSTSTSTQAFTFEVDKATGKAQIKWTTDPKDVVNNNSVMPDSAIQQALQTLIAQSGIGLSVPSGGLLPPPLGQFPAQGSDFGSAQDPVVAEPAITPTTPARKKRKTGGSSTQNTAASIPEGAPSFPCEFDGCDKVFARLYNLKSHSRTHTNERPFVCSHCTLAFSRNHDLKRHVKIHAGDKPFKCNGCGKSFSRLDALGRHRGNAKNRTGCSNSEAA